MTVQTIRWPVDDLADERVRCRMLRSRLEALKDAAQDVRQELHESMRALGRGGLLYDDIAADSKYQSTTVQKILSEKPRTS